MTRFVAIVVALAACGDDGSSGPALTIDMDVPITEGVNGTASVFDPLIGHTFGITFTATSPPASVHGMNADCWYTDFDLQPSERVATGDMASLVQTELVDGATTSTLHLESCNVGRPSAVITLREGAPHQAFFSCFVTEDVLLDGDYPQLVTFTATDCHATIDDVSVFRNFQSGPYNTTFTVDGVLP